MAENLNDAQRSAVEHVDGPLLILAGAGTGKTRIITHRIARLIEKGSVQPEQVMAVTFTRKAAAEMASRLESLLTAPTLSRRVHIGTFHALSASLLRGNCETTRFEVEILSESGQLALIKAILQEQGLSGPDWRPLETLRKISLAKGQLLSPKDLILDSHRQLARVYSLYQRSLEEDHVLDFDDLISALVRSWEESPKLLLRHQSLFRTVLVDEFQDVNEAQYRWLKHLTASHNNLCVVGDTDQSIYGFRGSSVSIFHRFQEDFPDALVIKLEQNFRSSQRILEAAGGVISHNSNSLTCKLWSENDPGSLLHLARLANESEEAQFVVAEIERLLGGSSHFQIYQSNKAVIPEEIQYGLGDFAVLYRTHAQSRPLKEALSRAGIPCQLIGEKAPFVNPAAEALLSYLSFAMDTSRVKDLRVIFNSPPRGFGDKALHWLDLEISKGTSPWEILRLASSNLDLPVRHQAAADSLRRIIVSLRNQLMILPLREAVGRGWEETGLQQHFQKSGDAAVDSFRWLHILAAMHGDKPAVEALPVFLQDLSHWQAGDFYDPRADAVTLMTMHAAKGLEFPVVFICGLDQDLVPFDYKNQEENLLQEERRLFYVAMTRARHLLVLSSANRRFLYGESRTYQASQFIKEIPAHCLAEVASAMLKQALAFEASGDKATAELLLQKLINRFPLSMEAEKAKQKLKGQ